MQYPPKNQQTPPAPPQVNPHYQPPQNPAPPPYAAHPPQPYPQRRPAYPLPPRPARRARRFPLPPLDRRIMIGLLVGIPVLLILMVVLAFGATLLMIYGSGDIVPGVSAAGVELGGKTLEEATTELVANWQNEGILLRDGQRTWRVSPDELGFGIDAAATAENAHAWGRDRGGIPGGLEALFSGHEIEPVLQIDLNQTAARMSELKGMVEQPAMNAGVRLVNGEVQAVPPVQGRVLNIEATLAKLQADAAGELADGEIELVMIPVAPSVTDAAPLVDQARALLSSPLNIEAYDPYSDKSYPWSLSPSQWSEWLVAAPDQNSPIGLSLALDQNAVKTFLEQQQANLPADSYLDIDESVARLNAALAANNLSTWIQVYHHPTTYTVQSGDMFSSIGYQLGIPYPYLQAANSGVSDLSVGQQINVPSVDELIPLPVVRHKRIIISISEQHLWAYENGNLVFDWVISTGISRSPTAPGVFQVQSHEELAYGAQWNLYMPNFMGVYHPGPNVEVMNGFHGFPTDANGGYLLWTNSLGRPATYGCILLSLENAETLYNWAEEGVVVEIKR